MRSACAPIGHARAREIVASRARARPAGPRRPCARAISSHASSRSRVQRARIVAPQRERAVVEQRERGQRGQRDACSRAHTTTKYIGGAGRAARARARRRRASRNAARAVTAAFAPQHRVREHALRVPRLLRKAAAQAAPPAPSRSSSRTWKWFSDAAALVVHGAVGRRDHEHAVAAPARAGTRPSIASCSRRCSMVSNDTTRSTLESASGSAVTEPVDEREVRRACSAGRACAIAVGRHVDADHARRALRQQVAAVAFAARRVEHALAGGERRDGGVAMPVLVPDRAAHFRQEALAGEGERGGRWWGRFQGRRARAMPRPCGPRTTHHCSRPARLRSACQGYARAWCRHGRAPRPRRPHRASAPPAGDRRPASWYRRSRRARAAAAASLTKMKSQCSSAWSGVSFS